MKTVEVLAISMLLLGNTVYGDCLLSWDEQASAEINISKEMKKIYLIMDSYLADKLISILVTLLCNSNFVKIRKLWITIWL